MSLTQRGTHLLCAFTRRRRQSLSRFQYVRQRGCVNSSRRRGNVSPKIPAVSRLFKARFLSVCGLCRSLHSLCEIKGQARTREREDTAAERMRIHVSRNSKTAIRGGGGRTVRKVQRKPHLYSPTNPFPSSPLLRPFEQFIVTCANSVYFSPRKKTFEVG